MTEPSWFAAYVRSCQERKAAERLSANGFVTYVPIQKVRHQWSDRVKTIDKLLIPGLVFIRCAEEARQSVFNIAYGICGFLQDKSCKERKALVIPDKQMQDFMRVVMALNGEDDIEFVRYDIEPGDTVRVIRGPLTGFVCECVTVRNRHKLVLRLGLVGSAVISIDASDVIKE